METRLNRLEEKLDSKLDIVVEKLHEINVTLARNTDSLEVHEKRTDTAEKKLDLYEQRLDKIEAKDKIVTFILLKAIPALAAILVFLYEIGVFDRFKN